MKQFYINIPGVCAPLKVSGHNEQAARRSARDRFGYGKRLPKGTKLYLREGV